MKQNFAAAASTSLLKIHSPTRLHGSAAFPETGATFTRTTRRMTPRMFPLSASRLAMRLEREAALQSYQHAAPATSRFASSAWVVTNGLGGRRQTVASLPPEKESAGLDWRMILSAIALSLLAAQSSFAANDQADETSPEVSTKVLERAPGSSASQPRAGVSQFAQAEITRYEEVIAAVTERAENEENPLRVKRYTSQLKRLSHELDLAKKAQRQWKQQAHLESEPFARENLKESIQSLQESGTTLLDEMIAADRQAEHDQKQIEAKNDESAHTRNGVSSVNSITPSTRPRSSVNEGRSLGQQ